MLCRRPLTTERRIEGLAVASLVVACELGKPRTSCIDVARGAQTRRGLGRKGQDFTVVAGRLERDQFLSSCFLIPYCLREVRVLLRLASLVGGLGVAGADLGAMTQCDVEICPRQAPVLVLRARQIFAKPLDERVLRAEHHAVDGAL